MSIPSLSKSIGWTQGIIKTRAQIFDLQRQLATGKKAATFAELGPDRTLDIALRARTSKVQAYRSSIETISLRMDIMMQSLDRFDEIRRDIRSDAAFPDYELVGGNRSALQIRAEASLEEALSLLRTEVGGRYLFSGRSTDTSPVGKLEEVMDGLGGRAGFRQHLDERRQADLGADGLGRLVVPVPGAADVTVSEDVDGSPFGFKLVQIASGLTGTTTAGPTGSPPSATLSFTATLPEAGETARLTLALPDGSEKVVELTAVEAGAGGDVGKFEIGADENATAANFQTALVAALEQTAEIDLAAASGYAAAEDFFNFDSTTPPQRVDGPPFDTATALRDATAADTVFWYKGDADPTAARDSAVGRIDDSMTVAYGARANEEAFTWVVQNLAVMAAETFDPDSEADRDRYTQTMERAVSNLSYPGNRQTVAAVHSQIAIAHTVAGQADERHAATLATAEDMLSNIETADPAEVSVKILQLQTRLQASYETTSILSQLSLVNYL
jgi:flagellin-like hook-associated protein FlgL